MSSEQWEHAFARRLAHSVDFRLSVVYNARTAQAEEHNYRPLSVPMGFNIADNEEQQKQQPSNEEFASESFKAV
ncbi:MAG: hypothetical protein LBL46_04255 [Rickettsiales bacterium]|jgi:hypothetical protein|nr:hypothetical protein [Rickettsiales bacterium]